MVSYFDLFESRYVEKVLNQISNINPDLIAITGDMVDGSIDYLKKDLEPLSVIEIRLAPKFPNNKLAISEATMELDRTPSIYLSFLIMDGIQVHLQIYL